MTFSTRREAAGALVHATQLNGKTLSMAWHMAASAGQLVGDTITSPRTVTAAGGTDPDRTPPVGGSGAYAAAEAELGAGADDVAAAAAAIAAATAAVEAAAAAAQTTGEVGQTGDAA